MASVMPMMMWIMIIISSFICLLQSGPFYCQDERDGDKDMDSDCCVRFPLQLLWTGWMLLLLLESEESDGQRVTEGGACRVGSVAWT